jgi:predicted GIY-YIG superfamily endonuclease
LCYDCWIEKQEEDDELSNEEHFESNLETNEIHTVYIMFYEDKEKIGYTRNLNSRLIEIKREFPNNQLVYFREFMNETEARRFEKWLKDLSKRDLMKFIADFQNKINNVKRLL